MECTIQIRWFPPSWFLITFGKTIIYLDPAWIQNNFRKYPKKIIFSHYPEPMDGLPEPDLPKADFIFVTHHHKDHQKKMTIERLSSEKTVVIGTQKCTADLGKGIRVVKPGDEFQIDNIKVRVFTAYNTSQGSSTKKIHHQGECNSYLLEMADKTVYHAGDTDFIPEMKLLGKVDVAMLPIGGKFTMDIDEAVEAAIAINPEFVIPMHYFDNDPQIFKEKVEIKSKVQIIVLNTGDRFSLN